MVHYNQDVIKSPAGVNELKISKAESLSTTAVLAWPFRKKAQDFLVATANAKLRDATEQLREMLMHRLRSEARIEEMEKRLKLVTENRQRRAEGT